MKSPHKEIEELYQRASTLGIEYIEAEARRIMRRQKKYRTFICAMGSAFFADKENRYYDADDVTLFPDLAKFLDEWDGIFRCTGDPFRLDCVEGELVKTLDW